MIIQLNPPLPMFTDKGAGLAHFLIDYGMETDLYFVIALDNGGDIWTLSNKVVKLQINQSLGRMANENS